MLTPQAKRLLAAADPYGIDCGWIHATMDDTPQGGVAYRPMAHPHFVAAPALGRIQWGNYAEADNTGSYFRYRTPKGRRGLGGLGDLDADLKEAQKDAQEGMETVEGVMKDVKKYGAALKGFIDFFSFGAGPIKTPSILYKGCPKSAAKVLKVYDRKAFIAAVADGYTASGGLECGMNNPNDWAHFGLKPPIGKKPSEEHIWNPIAGVWQTSPFDMTKDAAASSVKPKLPAYQTTSMAEGAQTLANGFAATLPKMFAAMDLLVQAKKWPEVGKELASWIRSIDYPRFVYAVDHGTTVTQSNSAYKGQPALKVMQDFIRKAVDVVAVTPTANRPQNIGALAVAATKYGLGSKLPAGTEGLPKTAPAVGGAAQAIGLGALLWFLLRFIG